MFYAAGRANTEECFGLIEHGYYAGEWMAAAADQIGGTVYGRLFPLSRRCLRPPPCYFLTRKSAGGESHQSLCHGNMRVKVGVEGAITISIFLF